MQLLSAKDERSPFERTLLKQLMVGALICALAITLYTVERFAGAAISALLRLPTAITASIVLVILTLTHLNYWKRMQSDQDCLDGFSARPISRSLLHLGTGLGCLMLFMGARDLCRLMLVVDPSPYLPMSGEAERLFLVILGAIPLALIQSVLLHKGAQAVWINRNRDALGLDDVGMLGVTVSILVVGLASAGIGLSAQEIPMRPGLAWVCLAAIIVGSIALYVLFPLPAINASANAKALPENVDADAPTATDAGIRQVCLAD